MNKPESWHQKKITEYLEKEGYFVVKLIQTNKNGIPDLLGVHRILPDIWCEVKKEDGTPSQLQYAMQEILYKHGQISLISYGFEHFKQQYNESDKVRRKYTRPDSYNSTETDAF